MKLGAVSMIGSTSHSKWIAAVEAEETHQQGKEHGCGSHDLAAFQLKVLGHCFAKLLGSSDVFGADSFWARVWYSSLRDGFSLVLRRSMWFFPFFFFEFFGFCEDSIVISV